MRILLTGAAGFIGSSLADRLLARGDEVVGFDNFDETLYPRPIKERNLAGLRAQPGFRFVEGTLLDERRLDELVAERPDVVVHLAALAGVRPSLAQPKRYQRVNIEGSLNLLEACRQHEVGRLVVASSSSVYGAHPAHGGSDGQGFREDDPAIRPASPYAATKRAVELLCSNYADLFAVHIASLRFFTVYGPRQRPEMAIHKFTRLIDQGAPLPFYGDGQTARDYTYIDDILDGVLAAIDRVGRLPTAHRVYNLGGHRTTTLARLVALLEDALGRKALLDRQPDQPGDVPLTYADVHRAGEELDYHPRIPIEEGIARFVRWYRDPLTYSPEPPTMTRRPMTLTQKILAAHAVGLSRPWVQAGDVLRLRVDWTIASELAWNGMDRTYALLGRPPIADPEHFFLAVDHTVDPQTLATDKRAQRLAQLSRDFAAERGIRHFYDANETILHTRFYRDLVQPGEVVLGADSHTSSHGGLGAFAIGLGGADITAALVLGESWIEVPEAIAVEYSGRPAFGIGGKDVILRTLEQLRRNTVAMERTVEYVGDVGWFSTDMRFTIANMTAEFGGLNGIFAADDKVAAWLVNRATHADGARYFRADPDAPYLERHRVDLSQLGPRVARPYAPDNVAPVEDVVGQPLQGAFIGACTTTEEELVLGALVLEQALAAGQVPVPTGRRFVVPGDLSIQRRLADAGLWAHYGRAGYTVDPPGCSMCLGVASRRAERDEHWISSQNRNFHNRMGEGSHAWLASAATVAASSLGMSIADPRPLLARIDPDRFERLCGRAPLRPVPEIRVEEPSIAIAAAATGAARTDGARHGVLSGRVQRFGDQVDTDAIIPGQFCHLTALAELGEKAFHFVRPEFTARVREGRTLVVAEEGWGSGSSREQAVWALQGAGIRAVIARSFAFIHKRNLVNEALPYLVVEDPAFYALVGEDSALEVDLNQGLVREVGTGRSFTARPGSEVVRGLTREGGLVPAIQRHGRQVFSVIAGG